MNPEGWTAAAGDLLLGSLCHGCGRPWWGVCPDCRERLLRRAPFRTRPEPCPIGFPVTVTAAPYDEVLRGLVNAHKERDALGLTRVLGELLARSAYAVLRSVGHPLGEPVVLVPVPSAARVVRQRGFDATHAMARVAGRRLRHSYRTQTRRLLSQRAGVRDQSGLGAVARQENLAGAYRVRGRPGDGPVLLVDDLVTTGSSLAEAARTLTSAGVLVLGAATVAATQRHRRPLSGGVDRAEKSVWIGWVP